LNILNSNKSGRIYIGLDDTQGITLTRKEIDDFKVNIQRM